MKAEAVLLHPDNLTIACRANSPSGGNIIQVFDLTAKKKLKQVEIADSVEYWHWLNSTILAVVSKTSVFHVDISSSGTSAEKIFDRDPKLAGAHIMGYNIDSSGGWCFLHGIGSNAAKQISGMLQLYSIEKKQGQFLEAYTGAFVDMPVTDNASYKNQLFAFVQKKANDPVTRLHIMEIGTPAPGQP